MGQRETVGLGRHGCADKGSGFLFSIVISLDAWMWNFIHGSVAETKLTPIFKSRIKHRFIETDKHAARSFAPVATSSGIIYLNADNCKPFH